MITKKAQKAAEVAANKRAAWFKRVNTLTGFLFGTVSRLPETLAAFEAGQTADEYAAHVASLSPVGAAIHPLKIEAIKYAADRACEVVERVRKDIAEHNGDVEAAAPYPDHFSHEYDAAKSKYSLYHSLVRADEDKPRSWRPGAPYFVIMSDEHIERFIQNSEQDAAFQYDMFICKMVVKVGPCLSASIDGNHIWSYSLLRVTKDDNVEIWKTQQIVNYSKFGRPYLQWPSRKVK